MLRGIKELSVSMAVLTLATPALAAETTSHAMTVVGRAYGGSGGYFGCATSGPQPQMLSFFNSGIGLPTEGYDACHLGGSISDKSGTTSSATSSATAAFNNGVADVSASAHANYASVGVESQGSFTGYTDNMSFHSSEAAAIVNDVLKFDQPVGTTSTNGFATLSFTIDGSMEALGNSFAKTLLVYQLGDNQPIYAAFQGITSYGSNNIYAPSTPDLSGFTALGASISGSSIVFTGELPVTYGQDMAFNWGLYAGALPGPNGGEALAEFAHTASLTGISLTDASGRPITDFSITSQSGTLYDANGAHLAEVAPVPEPATWALMLAGFGTIGATLRRRRTVPSLAA